ncbi:MAG: heme biosynthesis HemY N-terminal domain-containing protein [Paracoccaceae bacterium]|nr:heme biosynthesis HemY N-terminal domain-containing protein [Paracoccaceae bacterium]
MLWSLFKIILFIACIAALTLIAGSLIEASGGVQITVLGFEFSLAPLQAVILALVLLLLGWVLLKLASFMVAVLRFINGDDTAVSRYFNRNRERKGFQALSEGTMALASGEGRLALVKAAKAERYLVQPNLTNLLTAQAAEMVGDQRKAEAVYKRLVQNSATRFVGVRGIMKQKLAEGDTETALKLAKHAFDLKPSHEETQDVLLKLQAIDEDWSGARKTLLAKLKYGNLPRDVHRRRDAVLALSEAYEALQQDRPDAAHIAAVEANRLSPDLVPAAVLTAHGYIAQTKARSAVRVLKKAYEAQPHPDLAAAFAQIVPDETPVQRIKRFQSLVKPHPDHRETRLLLAELQITAEDFPAARRALGSLSEEAADVRALTIMAAIERGEGGSDTVVKGWLARAVTAPRGPQWVCDNCSSLSSEWSVVCTNCASFDSQSWRIPPAPTDYLSIGSGMLPLIIGALDDQNDLQGHVPEGEAQRPALETEADTTEKVVDQAQPAEDKSTSKQ